MASMNPLQLIALAKKKGPQVAAQQIIQKNFADNPLMQSLLSFGNSGNKIEIEKIAQQMLGQQGKDLNEEISSFLALIS